MAFFAAPFLLPDALFLVISPLKALTDDLKRRLRETGIAGGVWPSHEVHWDSAQLVLVSVHHAAGQDFFNLLQSPPIKFRLRRIFFDEAHKIPTDIMYRPLFGVIHHLYRTGIPIMFLSGSMMHRIIPHVLWIMKIDDFALVDEIRRDMGQPNLNIHHKELVKFISQQLSTLASHERGMIFTESRAQADQLGHELGIPVYHALLSEDVKTTAAIQWRNGVMPQDHFIAATEAFGAGINEPHVRIIIHSNPRSLTSYLQETGRAGRDGLPSYCFILHSHIPPPLSIKAY
ncbi:P-loop containing nucleoside triphosphate hydrolase protein [Lentinula boryana]|uniref:DNA 3'-5' helicase n=1 Tax=Lentinula boryana TaxID=40481 RepID=A0ABQ8Q049_9AGAR|nr:P-loop containing nucleoside triphosphate hydrolase protein [Lentinula boryana]